MNGDKEYILIKISPDMIFLRPADEIQICRIQQVEIPGKPLPGIEILFSEAFSHCLNLKTLLP
jgi:hypothetical protein